MGFMDEYNKKDFTPGDATGGGMPPVVPGAEAPEIANEVRAAMAPQAYAYQSAQQVPQGQQVQQTMRNGFSPTPQARPQNVTPLQTASAPTGFEPKNGASLFFNAGLDHDAAFQFGGEWRPCMETPNYIGTTTMLLTYLQELERKHHVTMPIKACGIDPIVFDNVENINLDDKGRQKTKVFSIPPTEGTEGEAPQVALYELLPVDGDLYLSCVSECLDNVYLGSILAEATASMQETGTYVFEMVGYRKLALEQGQNTARLLNTLRLNSYELSVLNSYLCSVDGVIAEHGTINGKACIRFSRGNVD